MCFLEDVLTFTPRLHVAADAEELSKRFAETGETITFWNPPNDVSSPVRTLAYFAPPTEGGLDRSETATRAIQQYLVGLVPWERLPPALGDS